MLSGVGINSSYVAMWTCRCAHRTIKRPCEARYTKPSALETSAARKFCIMCKETVFLFANMCFLNFCANYHESFSLFLPFIFFFFFFYVYIIVRFSHVAPFFARAFHSLKTLTYDSICQTQNDNNKRYYSCTDVQRAQCRVDPCITITSRRG